MVRYNHWHYRNDIYRSVQKIDKRGFFCKINDCEKQTNFNTDNYLPLNIFWIAYEKCYETNQLKSIYTILVLVEFYSSVMLSRIKDVDPWLHLQNIAINVFTFCSKFNIS